MWNRKLGRKADHRKALLRNMATSLIENGQIETTEMKAKELSYQLEGTQIRTWEDLVAAFYKQYQ